jgi:hypothetical protein
MKNIHFYLGSLLLVLGSIFTACGPDARLDLVGMFAGTSPTIDERFEQSMAYNRQAGYATIHAPSENYHVYVCTDTHIHKTRSRWEYFINAYRTDMLCPVAVHLGDIIDAKTDLQKFVEDQDFAKAAVVNAQLQRLNDAEGAIKTLNGYFDSNGTIKKGVLDKDDIYDLSIASLGIDAKNKIQEDDLAANSIFAQNVIALVGKFVDITADQIVGGTIEGVDFQSTKTAYFSTACGGLSSYKPL